MEKGAEHGPELPEERMFYKSRSYTTYFRYIGGVTTLEIGE